MTLEKRLPLHGKQANLAQQRYQAGVADILTLLDAQRTLLGLENDLFNVRAARTISYIQLYNALGGGWS
ncbi:MAG: TolC family protein [Akkermansiaceae bacterium]|nr:TolC family protein [Akkermansiaceae bacterium]